jgi:hypothetical protein
MSSRTPSAGELLALSGLVPSRWKFETLCVVFLPCRQQDEAATVKSELSLDVGGGLHQRDALNGFIRRQTEELATEGTFPCQYAFLKKIAGDQGATVDAETHREPTWVGETGSFSPDGPAIPPPSLSRFKSRGT